MARPWQARSSEFHPYMLDGVDAQAERRWKLESQTAEQWRTLWEAHGGTQ